MVVEKGMQRSTSIHAKEILPVLNSSHVQQPPASYHLLVVMVLITEKENLPDARLDDEFCTLIAREQAHIHLTPFDIYGVLV